MPVCDPFEGTEIAGNFELLELLGLGGWGVVYKARQVGLDRIVALKMLHRGLSVDSDISKRFTREAEVVSQLHHPNIAELIDYGILPGGEPYMIMEYLQGVDLIQLLSERTRLPFREAYPVLRQLCDALGAAHAKHIIHRDIKASNIRIIDFGKKTMTAKLLDFGLACWSADSMTNPTRLTQDGTTIGTPSYMSPEQCRGSAVDERSDIYALGCIMYEMLTGTLPFVAPNAFETMHGHIYREPPSIESHGVLVSPAVQQVVMTALAKDPAQRFQSVGELKRALDQCYADTGQLSGWLAFGLRHFPPLAFLMACLGLFVECSANCCRFPPRYRNISGFLSVALGGMLALAESYRRFEQRGNALQFSNCAAELLRLPQLLGGRWSFEDQEFQLVPLLEGCAELLGKKAAGRGISLAVFVSPAIPSALRGDAQQIRHAVLELADYLLDCATGCDVTIEAHPEVMTRGRAVVRFSVSIAGFAVSEDDLSLMFRRRSAQAHTLASPWGAAGIGLAGVNRLIELMGASLSIERRPRGSSALTFSLEMTVGAPASKLSPLGDSSRPRRVLTSGLPANLAQTIADYVESWGLICEAVSAAYAAEAIRRAAQCNTPWDVVILDDRNDQECFELASIISAEPLLAATQLVLLTGRKDGQDKAMCSGFSNMLWKPLKRKRLYECLARAMEAKSETAAVDKGPQKPPEQVQERPLVLLIDNDQEERRIILIQLRILGVDAHAVNSPDEAADGIQAGRYRMIMIDCATPAGYQMARAVRKLEPASVLRVPVVALIETENREQHQLFGAAAGISETIEKPIAPIALRTLVNTFMLADDDDTALVWKAEETLLPAQTFDQTAPLYTADADPINLPALNDTFGADTARELLGVFAGTADGLLEHVERALQRRHARSLELLSHQLKGSSGAIGAMEVARLAARLEEAARKEDYFEAAIVFEAAKFAVSKTKKFIERQAAAASGHN